MRLTVNNIDFVKELTEDGKPYSWYVAMKSHRVCDGRHFCYHDKEGRTVVREYRKEDLPKTVQIFIETHTRRQFDRIDARHYQYIYQ